MEQLNEGQDWRMENVAYLRNLALQIDVAPGPTDLWRQIC